MISTQHQSFQASKTLIVMFSYAGAEKVWHSCISEQKGNPKTAIALMILEDKITEIFYY